MQKNAREVEFSDIVNATSPRFLRHLLADLRSVLGLSSTPSISQAYLITPRFSSVFKITLASTNGPLTIYLKLPRINKNNPEEAKTRIRTEYDTMSLLHSKQTDVRYGVARPLIFYRDPPALVTLQAAGQSLAAYLSGGLSWAAKINHQRKKAAFLALERCAEWLNSFQEITKLNAPSEYDGTELLKYIHRRLILLEQADGNAYPERFRDKVMAHLESSLSNACKEGLVLAGRHNDFASHNIIMDDKRLSVIDFTMFDYGPVQCDASSLWFELEIMKSDPRYPKDSVTTMQQIFLDTYGRSKIDNGVFAVALTRHVVLRLLGSIDRPGRWDISFWYWRSVRRQCNTWLHSLT